MEDTESPYKVRIWPSVGERYDFPELTWNSGALVARTANSGVCFSGGGTRAQAAGMGQLRALQTLGVLTRVRYISCVSGGSWLAAPFTYYRTGPTSEEQFLGPVTEPEDITLAGLKELDERCAGHTATTSLRDALWKMIEEGVPEDRLWLEAVGRTFFEPFGLHDRSQPALFSLDEASVADIRQRNPSLAQVPIHTARSPQELPYLVVNACLIGPVDLAPFSKEAVAVYQVTPLACGSPYGMDVTYDTKVTEPPNPVRIGGGLLEPFAYASEAPARPSINGVVGVEPPARPFSIADASGLSSSAYAGFVEQPHLSGGLDWLDKLSPEAPTWPVTGGGGQPTTNFAYGDGGVLENYGLLSLLQRGVKNVVVFINTDTKLDVGYDPATRPPTTKDLDSSLPPLFGYQVHSTGTATSHNQVFARQHFATVVTALQQAKRAGRPLTTTIELPVQANPWWGIQSGSVTVQWHYLDRVHQWEAKLAPDVRRDIERGNHSWLFHGPFAHFPNYKTMVENLLDLVELTPSQVNLLADLTCWSVLQDRTKTRDLLTG